MRAVALKTLALGAAGAGIVALAPSSTLAAEEPDTPAEWLKRPTPETLMGVWPSEALRSGKGGYAEISCTINVLGRLSDCKVVTETPAGAGFGGAAMAMAPQMLFKPATKDGKAVPSTLRLPVRFPNLEAPTGSRIPGPGPRDPPPIRAVMVQQWDRAPTVADVAAAYPAKAAAAKLAGAVALQCALTRTGELTLCMTMREEPAKQGFASAAKVLARKFVGPTVDENGKSLAGARVQLPFTFAPSLLEGASPFLSRPKWIATPTAADLPGVPEAAAKARKLTARVVIVCTVGESGGLERCQVESEDPAGVGYGAATLRLSQAFKIMTWSTDGMPAIGAAVRAPMRFDYTDQVAAAPKP